MLSVGCCVFVRFGVVCLLLFVVYACIACRCLLLFVAFGVCYLFYVLGFVCFVLFVVCCCFFL